MPLKSGVDLPGLRKFRDFLLTRHRLGRKNRREKRSREKTLLNIDSFSIAFFSGAFFVQGQTCIVCNIYTPVDSHKLRLTALTRTYE